MTWPSQPGSMKPAVEWMSSPSRRGALTLEACDEIVGERDPLQRRRENELARVKDEGLLVLRLDELRQVLHRLLHVDVGVA